jgi:hypothetical protein
VKFSDLIQFISAIEGRGREEGKGEKKRNLKKSRCNVMFPRMSKDVSEDVPDVLQRKTGGTGYRRRAAKVGEALYDGAPSAWVAEDFRTRFKAGIQTIISRSAGRITASMGIPAPGHSLDKAAHDAVRWALDCLM